MIASMVLAACLVTKVHDGDTLTVSCPKRAKPIVVRVAEIDAPELPAFTWGEQPGARPALAEATALCLGQLVTVHLDVYDSRTKRWIAHVTCKGVDLSTDEASKGFAWSYLPSKGSKIPGLMAAAQANHIGLWAGPVAPIQPSVWRKQGMHQ